tara:strand:- start:1392 stop:1898 length:507 start_codon:yes stop_codon:yes gene_type:complete
MVPSAVHVDGTTRVHVVRKSENLLYWNLINEFKKLTGVPVLLNTSFNRHGIATISTPRQSVEHLLEGCMDYLALGDNLVAFEDNRIVAERNATTEPEELLLMLGSIKRLDVFKDFGTDNQMSGYLERLSDLIGEDIGMLENKNIKFRNKELDIKEAQDFIFDFVKGLY